MNKLDILKLGLGRAEMNQAIRMCIDWVESKKCSKLTPVLCSRFNELSLCS